jgi:WD40 repeat protein
MLDFPKNRILSPKPSQTYSFSDYITAIAFSNTDLAIATASGEVALASNSKLITLQPESDRSVDCLSFSENYLAAVGQSGKVNVWDVTNSEDRLMMSLEQGDAWIDFLAWQRSHFAFSLGKYVQVWSVETKDIVTTVNLESTVQALAWHPEGNYLAVGGYQSVKIWNALDWDLDPFVLPISTAINAIAWNHQGNCLIVATADEMVIFLDYKKETNEFILSPFQLSGFPSKIKAIAWADTNTFAISSGTEISVWQPHKNPNQGWVAEIFNQHPSNVNALEFQPQTKVLASGSADGIRLSKGAIAIQTLNAPAEITCLKWHPQGHKLAVGTDIGQVSVWDVASKSSGKSAGSKGFWK